MSQFDARQVAPKFLSVTLPAMNIPRKTELYQSLFLLAIAICMNQKGDMRGSHLRCATSLFFSRSFHAISALCLHLGVQHFTWLSLKEDGLLVEALFFANQ